MLKWIGNISAVILLQILFLGIYLQVVGKFPSRELGLAWQAIFTTPDANAAESQKEKAPPPPEIPSYEDLLQERLLASPEIARKIDELSAVRRAVEQDQKKLDNARRELQGIQAQLDQKATDEIEKARQQGEDKLLELVSAMKAKQAKDYLVNDPQEDRVLRLIIKMDPALAEKIFREFKQPADQRKLNGWLDRLGQGDPEAQRLRALLEQARRQPVT